jgi:hypothetical protein
MDKNGVTEAIRDIAINTMCSGNYDSAISLFNMALQYTSDDAEIKNLLALAEQRKQTGLSIHLAGSKWCDISNFNNVPTFSIIEFQPNEQLKYTFMTNDSPGKWSQNGTNINIIINSFSIMNVKIQDANNIVGTAVNQDGDTWQVLFRR